MAYNTRSSRIRMPDTLTFYSGDMTAARRSTPIPQMECVGKPCALFQPDVVQCTAVGGTGPDVEWKCQADLPSSIRFGRVEVSCEGYDHPDDQYILKGSCGLTYNLVRADPKLEDPNHIPTSRSRGLAGFTRSFMGNFFNILTLALVFYMLYIVLLRPLLFCFSRNTPNIPGAGGPGGPGGGQPPQPPRGWFGGWGGGGSGGGGGPSTGRPGAPPPPYSEKPNEGPSYTAGNSGGGMWSDLGREMRRGAAWGAGTTLAEVGVRAMLGGGNNNARQQQQQQRAFGFGAPTAGPSRRSPFATNTRDEWDRGEGPSGTSGLGGMRSSSGFGGTRNR